MEHPVWYEPQPHEPPSADPHARWCGRGAVMLTAPYADKIVAKGYLSSCIWGMEEVGIEYEHFPVSYGPDSKAGDYLAINPNGRI